MTKKYVVALLTGGVPEQPNFAYEDYQVIEANNEEEAEDIYDNINDCEYYFGHCVGSVVEINGEECIVIPIKNLKD